MNAAVVESFDLPPRYTSFADPVIADGEVRIDVLAAGLHPIVKSLANGTHYGSVGVLPFVPGVDGVGRLQDGSRVYFGVSRSPFGTFAEYTVSEPWLCLPLPENLDTHTVAAMTNPGMSSWAALKVRAGFTSGESVLILGATGIAGQLAVQIAKRLGARRVIAAGRNIQQLEELKTLGADETISLGQHHDALVESFRHHIVNGGIDIVLDYLWGQPAEALLQAIARKGLKQAAPRVRYLQVGDSAGKTISLSAATLRSSGLELLGSGFGSASIQQIMQAVQQFHSEAAKQPFQIPLETVSLRDIATLWNLKEQGVRLVFQP
jgi:NADPH:quinone reductase-like Zn-dependent oxidoreductase